MTALRLILNGKKAGIPGIRKAVAAARDAGHTVDVRVTWEAGDAARFAAEALDDDVDVIVAGGGDGTVNEIVNGIIPVTESPQTPMAVVPLGSANDFAGGCGIEAGNPSAALMLAATGRARPIDVARVNGHCFVNAAIAGFGAEVTFNTSDRMKSVIGGAAYGFTGFLTALKQTPYEGKVVHSQGENEFTMLFAAVANGARAGGFTLAPDAALDDGKLDVLAVPDFSMQDIPTLITDLRNLGKAEPKIVRYYRVEWAEVDAKQEIPLSPDGERMSGTEFRFDVLHRCLPFVLPDGAPLTQG
ncbi:MAG: lipid kinase YegS [Planctomycetota bacterium]|jgi:lipid kinase YegS